MRRKRIVTIVSIVVVALLLIKGKGLLDERRTEVKDQPTPSSEKLWVSVVTAKQGILEEKTPFLAEILADKSIELSTKLPGYVEKVMVEESQKVKKGDTLVRIDSFELRSSIDALQKTLTAQKSDLALAESIYARNRKLVAIGGISKENFTASKVAMEMKASALEGTKQKIAQLQHQLTYLKIKAPFDGVIDRIVLHEGDLAVTGKPILTMSNEKQKLLFSYTPSADPQIKKEQDVFYDDRVIGYVKSIYPAAKNGLRVAEIALNETLALPVSSFINVEVLTGKAQGCIVPDSTVVHKKNGTFVMAYQKGRFTPKRVEILLSGKNRILLKECPVLPIASASETRLSTLPAFDNIAVSGVKHEQ